MTVQERATNIIGLLREAYPDAVCSLDFDKDYQLLFATRLAAQCTDKRVNLVTKELYRTYPTLESFAEADIADLEAAVHPCGFFRHKARDIQACARVLLDKHGGRVPDTLEELLKLPGVGRKTANLILGDLFGKGGVVVDTHCIRLAGRFGLTESKNPVQVERDLEKVIPRDEQSAFCHRIVEHGRAVCDARRPACGRCTLAGVCPKVGVL